MTAARLQHRIGHSGDGRTVRQRRHSTDANGRLEVVAVLIHAAKYKHALRRAKYRSCVVARLIGVHSTERRLNTVQIDGWRIGCTKSVSTFYVILFQ